jgi:Contractile injection system tube protein
MSIGPRLVKAGIVLADPNTGTVQNVIALQYNPDTLTRSLKAQIAGEAGGHQITATRLTGAAVETIKLDAEIDATDQLAVADPTATALGVHPQLAVLETLVYPTSATLAANNALASSGTLEVLPVVAPLTLFVWSSQRIAPVQVTDVSVTEEAFDPNLNPIRAKVSLSLRVLSVDDLRFGTPGGTLFMTYLRNKEQLAARAASVPLTTLGVSSL